MFKFRGRLAGMPFLLGAMARVALFVAAVLLSPLVIAGGYVMSGCEGQACGFYGIYAAMIYIPVIIALFIFSFLGIAVRRARDAGIPPWMGLIIPVLILADYRYLLIVAMPGGNSQSTLALNGIPFPSFAVLGLVLAVVVAAFPSRSRRSGWLSFGRAGVLAFVLGAILAAWALLVAASSTPGLMHPLVPVFLVIRPLAVALPYGMVALALITAWLAFRQRSLAPQAVGAEIAAEPPQLRLPVKRLVAIAAALALLAVSIALPERNQLLLALLIVLIPVGLPTFLLMLALVFAGYPAMKRRTAGSMALLAIVVLPFLEWGFEHWRVSADHAAEASALAAERRPTLTAYPDTLVTDEYLADAVWDLPAIDHVIFGSEEHGRKQVERPTNEQGLAEAETIEIKTLPASYLRLIVGDSSSIRKRGVRYAPLGGPFELRVVAPGRDELVASWYQTWHPRPTILPVLTTSGWMRERNMGDRDAQRAAIVRFLSDALGQGR